MANCWSCILARLGRWNPSRPSRKRASPQRCSGIRLNSSRTRAARSPVLLCAPERVRASAIEHSPSKRPSAKAARLPPAGDVSLRRGTFFGELFFVRRLIFYDLCLVRREVAEARGIIRVTRLIDFVQIELGRMRRYPDIGLIRRLHRERVPEVLNNGGIAGRAQ